MKQPEYTILNHKNNITSIVKIHRRYSPAARTLHSIFDQACEVILIVSK